MYPLLSVDASAVKHLIAARMRGGGVVAGVASALRRGRFAVADGPTNWRKSRRCESHQCVEVAVGASRVAIRDSGAPDGPFIEVTATAWIAFCAGLRAGELSR
jgi:hypothetical protein